LHSFELEDEEEEKAPSVDAIKIGDLPSRCKQVAIGMSYNLFLLEKGQVYVSGEISYAYG
jgi:hypothetical protein